MPGRPCSALAVMGVHGPSCWPLLQWISGQAVRYAGREAVVPHPLAVRELEGRRSGMVTVVPARTSSDKSDKVEIMAGRRGCQFSDALA